jgi:hypothetical protein
MQAYWGSGGIAPRIFDLGTRRRWVISFTPRPLYLQGKSPRYALDKRMGGPQSRSGRGGEEKNSQPLPELEYAIIQAVDQHYTTELSRLHLRISKCLIQLKGKGKVVPVLNEAPRHEDVFTDYYEHHNDVLGERWYSSRHS